MSKQPTVGSKLLPLRMILLTGATGLTGAHLALHLLQNGEKVKAIYRNEARKNKTKLLFDSYGAADLFSKLEWHQADLNDIPSLEEAFEGVVEVCHCAGLISFNSKDQEQLRKTNIEGTANLINISLQRPILKFCYVSSIATLGEPSSAYDSIDESCEWNPNLSHHDYGLSKFGGEMEVWRGFHEGLNIAIVNPGIIIGPGFNESGSGQLFSIVKKGLPFYTKGVTGYVSVWDVAKILYCLLRSNINGERFILVSENLSFQEVITTIATLTHAKKPTFYAPYWLTSLLCSINLLLPIIGKKPMLTKDGAATLHKKNHYSNHKICTAIDFKFQSVQDALHKSCTINARRLHSKSSIEENLQ